jgi:hypothetical protein
MTLGDTTWQWLLTSDLLGQCGFSLLEHQRVSKDPPTTIINGVTGTFLK